MFFDKIFASRDPGDDFWYTPVGTKTESGVRVTHESALQSTAVFACVRVLAETIAALPLNVYQSLPSGGKQPLYDHWLYPLLHDKPNDYQSSFDYREMIVGHTSLRGNGYSIKDINARGEIATLLPLHPGRVKPEWTESGRIIYVVQQPRGNDEIYTQEEILHIRGLSSDGLTGLSPIEHHRESVGMSLAAQNYGARFFANDARPRGILEHPTGFKDLEALNRFKAAWREQTSGSKQHSTAVLEDGIKYTSVGMSNNDAQFLETRKYQTSDIARIFRIPPHMIGDLEKATFSNIEQQSIEFVVHTITPWLVRIEQAIKCSMIVEPDVFVKFNVGALLRGDTKTRYEAYKSGIDSGWLTRNEVRELEDRNPIEGLDEPLTPLNMTKENRLDDMNNAAAGRVARKEHKSIRDLASKRFFVDRKESHISYLKDVLCVNKVIAENAYNELLAMFDEEILLDNFVEQRTARLINLIKGS